MNTTSNKMGKIIYNMLQDIPDSLSWTELQWEHEIGLRNNSNNIKKNHFYELFKSNDEGVSRWVSRKELSTTSIAFTDNGNVRQNKPQHFPKDVKEKYIFEYQRKGVSQKGTVTHIRTNGFDTETLHNHPIGNHIKKYYDGSRCVVCGIKADVSDHKNDLYNDPRVLNVDTQTVDDFQPMCNGCNLKKRQISIKTKEENKRVGATYIPQLAVFGIDFIEGDETLNISDPNAMKGTYWYDPIEFMKFIKEHMSNKRTE
jgi:hypothetical protein